MYMDRRKTTKKAVDKARNDMEADLYTNTKLDEGAVKKMIYKMTRHQNEYSKDAKGGTFIKDSNGKLVTTEGRCYRSWKDTTVSY